MESEKSNYIALCEKESSIPVFMKPWWLDAVCGSENWNAAVIKKGDTVIAAMPYYTQTKLGFTLLRMPVLSSGWGPWIYYPPDQKYESRLGLEMQLYSELIAKLPDFDFFNQRFRSAITNGLPFYWKGFKLTTRYTYIIPDLSNLDKVFAQFSSGTRSQIRKAQKSLQVTADEEDIEAFYAMNVKTFERQQMAIPYDLSTLRKIDDAAKQHQSRKIFIARDDQNRIHASLYLVWDKFSAYYLMGNHDPSLSSGGFSLLMYEAIKHSALVTQRFDFEGSMLESVERFFRSFGAVQTSYLQVQRINSAMLNLANTMLPPARKII